MNRPRIPAKPLLGKSSKWVEIPVQVTTNKTRSEEIREKLEAMFSPRMATA